MSVSVRATPKGLLHNVIDHRTEEGFDPRPIELLTFRDLAAATRKPLTPLALAEALSNADQMGINFDLGVWLDGHRASNYWTRTNP